MARSRIGDIVKDNIRFFRDQDNRARFESQTGYFADLGFELTSDIQGYAPDCIELLSCIDDVMSGGSDSEEFEGNSSIFRCDSAGVTVESLGPIAEETTYTVEEARAVIRQYFHFLAPTAEEKAGHLQTWEQENGRPYSNRDEVIF
jgi:hypothetical protein